MGGRDGFEYSCFSLRVCQTAGPEDKHSCVYTSLTRTNMKEKIVVDYSKIYCFLSVSGNKKGQLEVV